MPTTWTSREKRILGLGESEPPPDFVLGVTEPSAANCGLLPGWTEAMLGNYTGPAIYTGTAPIRNMRIPFWLELRGSGQLVENCKIVGDGTTPTSGKALIRCDFTSNTNTTIRNCVLEPQLGTNSEFVNGIQGHDYTVERCDIGHVVDHFGSRNPNTPADQLFVKIRGNYLHDSTWFPSAGQSDGQTHNDQIQFEGGNINGSEVIGNSFNGRDYSPRSHASRPVRSTGTIDNGKYAQGAFKAVQFTDLPNNTYSNGGSFLMEKNWFRGFQVAVNAGSAQNVDLGTWRDNWFDDAQGQRASLSAGQGHTMNMDPLTTCITTGNIYMDTVTGLTYGTPITVRRNQ